jgi:magnesium transporter
MNIFHRRFTKPGASPGTVVVDQSSVEPVIHELAYNASEFKEAKRSSLGEIESLEDAGLTSWIDVRGHGDGSVIQELGARLGLHSLAIADVLNVGQRPKVDTYEGGVFMAMRMVTLNADGRLHWEQVTLFVGHGYLVTFQETHGDCLEPLRERLRRGRKTIRGSGAHHLAVSVVDAIVDGYFPVLEHYGDKLESFEDDILERASRDVLPALYLTKRDLAGFRRAAWPLREALAQLLRDDESELTEQSKLHLRDTLDHAMQVVEVNETYRELTASLVDVHLSMVGQHTNDIMRVLTVISAIFIPMTFVAGIYGMNFDTRHPANLPELGWQHGYLFFWGVCFTLAVSLLVLFRRLGWLSQSQR